LGSNREKSSLVLGFSTIAVLVEGTKSFLSPVFCPVRKSGSASEFKDAVEKAPKDVTAWIGLVARSYDKMRRFDLADQAYAQAIRRGSNCSNPQ